MGIQGQRITCALIAVLAVLGLWTSAQAQPLQEQYDQLAQAPSRKSTPTASASGEHGNVAKINEWTVGIAGGPLESTLLRFVAELAIALNDDDKLRILPIVSAGSVSNVADLLYLRGVDLAMTTSDALEEFKTVKKVSNIERRINYVLPMLVVELNILARPEIKTLKDLEGKKVGFHVRGGAPTLTGKILFDRLGIKVEPVFVNNSIAYERMKTGEIAAILHPGGKPNDFLLNLKVEPGFHMLSVDIDKFLDYYVPTTLTHQDYPKLIPPGKKVEALGIIALLAVYNWPQGSERHRKVERFIEQLVMKFDTLTKPPFHPKWKEVSLDAKVPGWTRYWVLDQALAKAGHGKPKVTAEEAAQARQLAGRAAGGSATDQDRLFQEFLEWRRKQGR